ncbi:hypothetical protein Q5P01_025557 [Channa striata]|uniref:Ig-like domain-containing protein n=1 Tax=Channa striata TaxID=64152 RepID=A0AA88LLX9_CHASR|nr:hypothetical protein Q5P01_025557 [Channa striata]
MGLTDVGCAFMILLLYISGLWERGNCICALTGSSVALPCSAEHPANNKTWYTITWHEYGVVKNELSPDGRRLVHNASEGQPALIINDLQESDENIYCCMERTDTPEECWSKRTQLQVAGSSVDLPCSYKPASSPKWYTPPRKNILHVWNELYADGEITIFNMTEESNFTLTINDLSESNETLYCCKERTDDQKYCQDHHTELYVADLQVKVIPATENQTVTLMCRTSCALSEKPAAYIWYRNREFLYEDWSPWYQELVSSEEGVTYSCAIKGHEHLRAPDVSVDSVTSACFNVTYAKGRMCSHQQKPENESCSITYPTEVHVYLSRTWSLIMLTCKSSCLLLDTQTTCDWIRNKVLFSNCQSPDSMTCGTSSQRMSCAVRGHEDLFSNEVCTDNNLCWTVNYASRRICALEGSSVNISSEYNFNKWDPIPKRWYKITRRADLKAESVSEDAGGIIRYYDNSKDQHTLTINHLKKSDSGAYSFGHKPNAEDWTQVHVSGVILVVTGLKVTMAPSAEVIEDQRVTLTCSTSCPLTDNKNYIWHLNGQPLTLPESQNKHLILDPVSVQDAGNYSCVVTTHQNISSTEAKLIVKGKSMLILNAAKLTLLSLLLPGVPFVLYLWTRKKKTLTSTAEPSNKVQTGQSPVFSVLKMEMLYESIALSTMNPAAQADPAEQQEDAL